MLGLHVCADRGGRCERGQREQHDRGARTTTTTPSPGTTTPQATTTTITVTVSGLVSGVFPTSMSDTFDVTVNSPLEDPWGMKVGFATQMIFIFIDTGAGGFTDTVPGLNVKFDEANAWDKLVILSPQPVGRVKDEVSSKAAAAYAQAVKLDGTGLHVLPGAIDVHVHFLPRNIMDKVWAQFDSAGPLIGRPWPLHYRDDDAVLVETLRSFGVRRFTALPYAHKPGMAEFLNDWAADLADRYSHGELRVTHDQNLLLWRFHHVRVVERLIGAKMGTGGSPGVRYLESTLTKRAYPLLWSARGLMSDEEFYGTERGPTRSA